MPESDSNEKLRLEFNRWADIGAGEGMEAEHLPITLPVLDRMQLAADENILDVGCGSGWLARLLSERVPQGRVVGMDISDEMVRHARRNCVDVENAMFIVGSADQIPWDANFFTQTISIESAYYWPDPARALSDIFRVLRDGGSAWILINYYRENTATDQWVRQFKIPAHLLGAEQWAAMFREAGFASVAHDRIPDPTPVPESYEGRWFKDVAQLKAFRENGALLIWGTKPIL